MSQSQNVVVISDSTCADFARTLMARWQLEREVPAFALLNAEFWDQDRVVSGGVAVIASLSRTRMERILRSLAAAGTAAVCASNDPGTRVWARSLHPRTLVVPPQDAWADALVELGVEVLARVASEERARQAERLAAENQHFATLGRYMVEMRHSFNNAMTSLLGNAELLLEESGAFSARVREQLRTIRSAALRLHQMMQRFSSLEAEMQMAEEESQAEQEPLRQSRAV
jgi:signal transduction histidine kinase